MTERVGDLMAKGTVNVSVRKLVGYETHKRSVIGYIMNSFHNLRAFGCDIFLVRIQKYDYGS
jgi:hypothetical protein